MKRWGYALLAASILVAWPVGSAAGETRGTNRTGRDASSGLLGGLANLARKTARAAGNALGRVGRAAKRLWKKATGGDRARPDTPAAKATLPPEGYLKRVGCPFARWFSKLPARFRVWEQSLIRSYEGAWKRAGRPRGVARNDHNYDTLLGQGNTHGFVAGSLSIDVSRLPAGLRVGLFAKPGKYPVVVRLSDFGADASPFRLGRLALKLPFPTAWSREINWLFTETLDTFPLANYEDLATFARDPQASVLQALTTGGHIARSILGGGLPTVSQFGDGFLLGKTYYSQVPYALGERAAMRFRLVSRNRSSRKYGRGQMREGVRRFLAGRSAVFDLEIQIHPDQKSEAVTRRASSPWRGAAAKYHRVGRLVLARQATDGNGMGRALARALRAALRPAAKQAAALHKLFYFHPLLTAAAHRPLGEINSFRADFYAHHAAARFRTIQSRLAAGRDRFVVPFRALVRDRELRALFGH